MGLDISVCKIVKPKKEEDLYYFSLIDDEGNYRNRFPEWTKQFESTVTEKWYDWKKFKEDTGIDINNCRWLGESYNENGSFMEVWPLEYGEYPIIENFKIGEDENGPKYDWDKYDEVRKEHTITIDLEKVPVYDKEIKVLYYIEVGYQRKGLNEKFYEDYENGKIGYFVWDKKELQRYKKEYCDKAHEYVYPSGEKSGKMIYPKLNFQRSIIDNFEQDKCVVTFDW